MARLSGKNLERPDLMDYKRQQTLKWPAAGAFALALTLIAYFVASLFNNGSNSPLASVIKLNMVSNRDVQISGSYIYYLESGSLHCVDTNGKYVWNQGVDANSQFYATDYGITVWSGKKFAIYENDTGVSTASTTMPGQILSACVGDLYAAVVLEPEHDSTVILTDRYGNTVDTLTDFAGLTVMDFGFFAGRDLFWIMTLDSSGSTPACTISTYKPGKRNTGTIVDMEQVIYQVMFRSSQIIAVGTNYLRLFDYHGDEIKDERQTVYGWYLHDVDKSSDNPLMLFVPNQQAEGQIQISDVRMIRGHSDKIVHLPIKCNSVEAKGTTMYGFSTEHIVVYPFDSIQANAYKLPMAVNNVIGITDDKTAVVTSGGSIYLIKLP